MNTARIEEKIGFYQGFWKREEREAPLLGLDGGGFFPFQRFSALDSLRNEKFLAPEMLEVDSFLEDYQKYYHSATKIPDHLLKGLSPIPAIPWMEAIVGCQVKIAGDSIWALERQASWEELERVENIEGNPWLEKYLEFVAALNERNYPVGQPIMRGVSDLLGALRGHEQSLIDGLREPERVKDLAHRLAYSIIDTFKRQFEEITPYYNGYIIEQYSVWADDKIIRMQEDASAIYSPQLYQELLQSPDSLIASAFPYTLLHLHSSSLFLLPYFLEIEGVDLFQINKDVGGMEVDKMLPFFLQVQEEERGLLIRGLLTEADLLLIKEHLSPIGLILQVVLDETYTAEEYITLFQQVWR